MTAEGRQGVPTTADLITALRTFLEDEVMPATEGHLRYMARVGVNVAASVERELRLGPALACDQAARLASLGVASEDELAEGIREGRFDDRLHEVVELVSAGVIGKLSLWNLRYLAAGDAGRARAEADLDKYHHPRRR